MRGCSCLDGLVGAQVIGQGGHTVTFVGGHDLLAYYWGSADGERIDGMASQM